jgi:hypothetical protein
MLYREPLDENLLDELTRLVGRPSSVLREVLSGVLRVVVSELNSDVARALSSFPMTAWQGLAPDSAVTRGLWSAILSSGLTAEEVFTALAVVDDHVRRRYGSEAWTEVHEWAPRLAGRYGLETAWDGTTGIDAMSSNPCL